MCFQKKITKNSYILAYDFSENRQFVVKIHRNSIFLDYDSNILNQLYIMVPYMNFYGFLKNKILPKIHRC
jgi:hypothetical protein